MLTLVNADDTKANGSLIEEIVREGARRMLATALEAEVNSYLADLAGQRDGDGRRLVVRNGFYTERTIVASAGPVQVTAPRVALGFWKALREMFREAREQPRGVLIERDQVTAA